MSIRFRPTMVAFSLAIFGGLLAQGQDQSSAAAPSCAISGRVSNQSTGESLKGAQIHLTSVSDKLRHDTQSNYQLFGAARLKADGASVENGLFCLAAVKAGRYFLSASMPGFLDSSYGAKTFLEAGSVIVVGDKPIGDVNLALTPLSGISGRVVDVDGAPIEDANVSAIKRAWVQGRYIAMPVQGTQSDEHGEYRIGRLTPGTYFVSVLPTLPGSSETSDPKPVRTFYPGVLDQDQATTVSVVPGQDLRGIDIRAIEARTVHVTGKVAGAPSLWQGGAVTLLPRGEEPPMLFLAGGGSNLKLDGSFDFRDVNPGAYVLSFRSETGAGEVPVDVGSSDVSVSIPVISNASLNGQVVIQGSSGQSANAFAGKQVHLTMADAVVALNYSGRVGRNGEFVIANIVPGKYFISITPPTSGVYTASISLGGKTTAGPVDLSAGGPADVTITLANGTATLTGTVAVSDEDAETASLYTVLLSPATPPADGSDVQFAATDDEHHFVIGGIAPGKYRAYAFQSFNSTILQDPNVLEALKNFCIEVDLGGNESKSVQLRPISPSDLQSALNQVNSQ